mgnify:CR=1 FL=1
MILSVGELREALRGAPDDAFLSLDVVLQGTGAPVGSASVASAALSEPDMPGFRFCRIVAELPIADLVTSEVLEHVPPLALEELLATGKVPAADIEDGMREP